MGDLNFNMFEYRGKVFATILILTLLNIVFLIILRIYRKKLNLHLLANISGWGSLVCIAAAVLSHFIMPYKLIYEGFGQHTMVNYPVKFYFLFQAFYLGIIYLYLVDKMEETKMQRGLFATIILIAVIISSVYFYSQDPKNLSEEEYEEWYVKMGGRG